MVEMHAFIKPGGVVTGTTRQGRLDVVCRLADTVKSVMAGLASARLHHDMAKDYARKASKRSRMTGVASCSHGDMVDRLGQRSTRIILNVAGGAVFGGTFEYSVDMACLATHHLMWAVKGETCANVIKRARGRLRKQYSRRKRHYE
jgi:hypothetical protein